MTPAPTVSVHNSNAKLTGKARSPLKIILYTVGAICIAIVALASIGFGYIAYNGNKLDTESQAFVDSAVPSIAAHWNENALLALSSPEFRATADPERMLTAFTRLSELGPLVQYEGAKGEANVAMINANTTITGLYAAKARFQFGEVMFRFNLIKKDGRWMILHIQINPAFTGQKLNPA